MSGPLLELGPLSVHLPTLLISLVQVAAGGALFGWRGAVFALFLQVRWH